MNACAFRSFSWRNLSKNQSGRNLSPDAGNGTVCARRSRIWSRKNRKSSTRIQKVEEENLDFANRYVEIENENNMLANLYIASYQLHSTLDFREVLQIITEIVINLIGAEEFAIMLIDDKTNKLQAVASEGLEHAN